VIAEYPATELIVTLAALAAGACVAGLAVWLERRPRDTFKPLLVPTTPMLFAGLLILVLAAVHLLNLYGVKTGS
jgi:hypothetical protein